MKRISLQLKYSLLFFTLFFLTIIFLSKIIDTSNETIFISSAVLLLFFIITLLFLNKEITLPLQNIFKLSGKLKLRDDDYENFEHYDQKISELIELIEKLQEMKSGSVLNKEIFSLINEIHSITNRTLHELETAKVFKVNRNEFMGNVAHELITPIFAIQLSLETLLDGAINDDKVNMDFLNRAFNQTKRLKELVNDLLSISKFETGVKMSKRYFGISAVLRKTVDEMKSIAQKKNILLEYEESELNGITVFGDEMRLQQVMINLIDNAIKYTPEKGSVKVYIAVKEKEIIIYVEDTGIGIPARDLPRIFERFYRVDKTRSRDVGGSGLGLSIVKHILEAHSSQIKVESIFNKGTRFEFNLKR